MRQADDPPSEIFLRRPCLDDAASLWQLASDNGLDLNSPYAYLLLCRDFTDTCLVADTRTGVVGFVTGYLPPSRPDVLFVWQVAVDAAARQRGIGRSLVDELVTSAARQGARFLESTVTPSNEASRRVFESVAARRSAPLSAHLLFDAAAFAGPAHEEELLLRIGPLQAADAPASNAGARAP